MTIREALEIIAREGLGPSAIEPEAPGADEVVLARDGARWVVYATDERAAIHGVVHRFETQAEAVERFIETLRLGTIIEQLQADSR